MLKEEKLKKLSERWLKDKLWQRKHREKPAKKQTPNTTKLGYSLVQAVSCATNKVKKTPSIQSF